MAERASGMLEFLRTLPSIVEEKRTFLLILDGLGANEIRIPKTKFIEKKLEAIFPSSTPTFFYSFHSLLPPKKHGYLEWYMRFKNLDEPITIPPWKTASGKKLVLGKDINKKDVFPFKSFSEILNKRGISICFYTPFADSVFTKVTSKWAKVRKIKYFSEIFPLENCDFSFLYWPSVDAILHKNFKNESFKAELKILSFYIRLLWKKLPKNSKLVITSDHGLTKVKKRYLLPSVAGSYPVGGGRLAFYKNAELEDVKDVLKKRKVPAKIYSLEELFRTKRIDKRCYENFGNIAVVANEGIGFRYPFEKSTDKIIGHHGGKTAEEMFTKVWIGEK